MPKTQVAKLFKNGASQAVRLPAEFRFEGDHVYATRDEKTNNVILSERPGTGVWNEFFEFVRGIDAPQDWMQNRPMNRTTSKDRTVFREED
jgi:antitoxin VapB